MIWNTVHTESLIVRVVGREGTAEDKIRNLHSVSRATQKSMRINIGGIPLLISPDEPVERILEYKRRMNVF